MLGYVLKVEVWDRFRPTRKRANLLGLPESIMAVIAAYDAACSALARRGMPRFSHETPAEFLGRSMVRMESWPEAQASLDRLTVSLIRFRYSQVEATMDDVRRAQTALITLREALRGITRRALTAATAAGGA